jgi:hypothetical protein
VGKRGLHQVEHRKYICAESLLKLCAVDIFNAFAHVLLSGVIDKDVEMAEG